MALTLMTQPGSICFARNQAIYGIRADSDGAGTLYDARGVYSTITAALTDRFATSETLSILYTELDGTTETITLIAAASYDAINKIPDDSYAGADADYWSEVIDKIAQHPRIAPFFTVSYSGGIVITVQARSTDAGWDIETTTTSGTITTADFAATASALPENYRVLFEVFFEDTYRGGDFRQAAQMYGHPESGTGMVYFDISQVLSAECRAARAEPMVPVWSTDVPALADNLRRYYVRYTAESGAPPVAEDWQYGSTNLTMDGGIGQSLFAEGDFLAGLDSTDALLTWMPDGRKLGLQQPEFLAWYNHAGSAKSVYVEMQWYDVTDNALSSSLFFFDGSPLSVRAQEVALLPVNPTLLGLDAEPAAYKYRVRVTNGAAAWSQWRTYYIDRDYYESERYLQYLNGFGVPEYHRCTGVFSKKLKVERSTAQKPLMPGYNETASDRYQYARAWDNELTYRTGYLPVSEAETMQEMLIAGEVYDVSSEGYIPLLLTSNAFEVTETRQDLRAYAVQCMPRLDSRNYSKKKLTTLLAGAWLEPGGDAWFDDLLVAWEEP